MLNRVVLKSLVPNVLARLLLRLLLVTSIGRWFASRILSGSLRRRFGHAVAESLEDTLGRETGREVGRMVSKSRPAKRAERTLLTPVVSALLRIGR